MGGVIGRGLGRDAITLTGVPNSLTLDDQKDIQTFLQKLYASGTLLVQRGPGRLSIYDPASIGKMRELTFPFPVSGTIFTRDSKKLYLLTNDQVLYSIDPSEAHSQASAPASTASVLANR